MKKLFIILCIAALFGACKNTKKAENTTTADTKVEKSILKDKTKAKTILGLLETADSSVDNIVFCKGRVKHVCSHSGKRCFIADGEGFSVKVESGGKINGFNRELLGQDILVKGFLRKMVVEKKKESEEDDHCDTESNSLTKMQQWLKDNGKDINVMYYIDCIDYEIAE